ncbi:MAG: hypothetical protein NVSMB32_15640 [Actinomycetota bacterium]
MSTMQDGPPGALGPYEPHGFPSPPGLYGPPSAYGRPLPRTNALAVASLVLALVWLGGIGSLLAVVSGFIAHGAITRSQGAEAGSGLAIGGVVIGAVGLLGTLLVALGLLALGDSGVSRVQRVLTPRVFDAGQTATLSPSEAGITQITVFGLTNPVTADDPAVLPAAGDQFAVADVQVCAGPKGAAVGDLSVFWSLGLRDGSLVAPRGLRLKAPVLDGSQALTANQCGRGFLGFELLNGATPDLVSFNGGPIGAILGGYQWRIPTAS